MHRLFVAAVVMFALTGAAAAQQLPAAVNQTATIKRTPLQKFEVPTPRPARTAPR